MPENTESSHFVPRSYLRFFSDPNKTDYIYGYDKKRLKVFGNSIRRVATINWFYRLMSDDGSFDNSMEDYFHIYEDDLEDCIKESVEQLDKGHKLDNSLIFRLSRQIPHLMFRTNQMRSLMQFFLEDNARRLERQHSELDLSYYKSYNGKSYQIDLIRDESKTSAWIEALTHCFWIPIYGRSKTNVYTSDDPIITTPSALSNENIDGLTDIYFPLSSKYLLWIIDPSFYLEQGYSFNGRPEVSDPIIERNTTLQCVQSLQFIFSSKEKMDDVHKIVNSNPEIQSPADFYEDNM